MTENRNERNNNGKRGITPTEMTAFVLGQLKGREDVMKELYASPKGYPEDTAMPVPPELMPQDPELYEAEQKLFAFIEKRKAYPRRFRYIKSPIIDSARKYMEDHFLEPIRATDVAEQIFVSHSYLSSIFRKEMGVTIPHYVEVLRIYHSLWVVLNTNVLIKDLSLLYGFSSGSYYSKTFRKMFGLTPGELRKAWDAVFPMHTVYELRPGERYARNRAVYDDKNGRNLRIAENSARMDGI